MEESKSKGASYIVFVYAMLTGQMDLQSNISDPPGSQASMHKTGEIIDNINAHD